MQNGKLTKGERTALQQLNERYDIVITKNGKDGTAVKVNVEDYISEAESQMKKKDLYLH